MAKKIVINVCYGGFGISEAAYERLIALGVPVGPYVDQKRGPDGLYLAEPANDGRRIFDNRLSPPTRWGSFSECPYWDCWFNKNRDDAELIRVVEELGAEANGDHATLLVVEIPDDVQYEIAEYDGFEHVAETHRTWP